MSKYVLIIFCSLLLISCDENELIKDPPTYEYDNCSFIADEIFVTSTSFCICPVSAINGLAVKSESVPGKITLELQNAYSRLVKMDFVKQYLDKL